MSLIRRVTPEHPIPPATAEDPLRWLLRWDPFREMTPSLFAPPAIEATFSPAFEVKENKDSFLFKADLPGMAEKDIEIKLDGVRLTVSGKREADHEEKGDTFYTFERSYGSFMRAFTLPDGIEADHVKAELKDGVLTIVVPKKAVAQAKTIEIKPGDVKKS
ncbi:MAG TPA: Hsp20/alpha crystallin family protein [Kofleriaceae bacterium]|nr:Hsp20/alpha crystallin family protein [Kofleriaceae bacterium]